MKNISKYEISHHNHKLAVWAASRAASTSVNCRFRVEDGAKILEECGFKKDSFKSADELPDNFDSKHHKWCKQAIKSSKGKFTYGVAAKLINCYLKVRFVCAGYDNHEKVKSIHPPIDSLLLKEIKKKFGGDHPELKEFKAVWSKFREKDYKEIIRIIKEILKDEPLWKIEDCWPVYNKKLNFPKKF